MKELIANGASIDLQNKDQQSALPSASQFGFTEVVTELIANGASIDYKIKTNGLLYHLPVSLDLQK